MKRTTKTVLAVILSLCLCIGMIPMGMLSASADVDEGGANQGLQMPTPQNVQATLIGFVVGDTGKAVVVEIEWDALPSDINGGNKFVEMYPSLKEDENLSLPMSFEAWMGQATLIPVDELQEGGIGYVTKDGRSKLRSVVHILQAGDLKVDENGMACGVKENDKIDIDIYTAGYDPETQTDGESEHKHVEIVYTEENVNNKKTFTEVSDSPECTHNNKETSVDAKSVSSPVVIDGKTSNVMLIKESEKCSDCLKKLTTRIYRLRFKSKKTMKKYLKGRTVKLLNGKKVHFKGKYEKVEKVFWNKKYIKISVDYLKKMGSVILEFSDEFLAGVEDGVHELMVLNGDEFTAMSVTVSNHEITALGAFDTDSLETASADEYDALMQECAENNIEVVDCDLDAFYEGGFMTDANDKEVVMNLSENNVSYTGSPITPPAVTLTNEAGVEYAEDEDYTLTFYQIAKGADGEETEVEVDRDQITEAGTYKVVALPTRNGVLSGEAWSVFDVVVKTVLGDADGDGKVTIKDATEIQRHIAEFLTLTGNNFFAADVDGNGVVTISDATETQRYLAEFDTDYPIGTEFVPGEQIAIN